MNKSHYSFLILVSLIFITGLVMVFNTSAAGVLNRSLAQSTHHVLGKQILYAICGVFGGLVIHFVGFKNILKSAPILLKIGTLLLLLVFVPGIGMKLNGASRWIGIAGLSFQPSEFVKYIIPLYYIHAFSALGNQVKIKDFFSIIAKIAIPLGLILIEPDNGTAAMIIASLAALFLLSRVPLAYWFFPLLILGSIGVLAASQMPHVHDRIRVYMHPETDVLGKGHQPYQAKIAAGSGGLLGKGLGKSLQKMDYLPLAHSDYIAAIYAEEFGFLGMVVLIVSYMLVGYFGFSLAMKSLDINAFYGISILTFMLCFQAFLNLGVVSCLLPSKGINLPFFSQGGTSLSANVMAVALLLNASLVKKKESYGKKI